MDSGATIVTEAKPARFAAPRLGRLAAALIAIGLAGCAGYAQRPELAPEAWAPPSAQREWQPTTPQPANFELFDQNAQNGQNGQNAQSGAQNAGTPASAASAGQKFGLAPLVDMALAHNPQTRQSWEAARAAAAQLGIAEGAYYPSATVTSQNGYERAADLVPKHWGVIKSWQSRSLLSLNYLLLDFGRRGATVQSASQRAIAANFLFNRAIQQVVFEVEEAFYTLNAAKASVAAAQSIEALALKDQTAATHRRKLGLATEPQLLLATQRAAQAGYELEKARLAVSDAQARLAVALGVEADAAPDIEDLSSQPLPAALGENVTALIKLATRQRPDLAAKAAGVRAAQAEVELAHADLYPTLEAGGYYGGHAFNYNLSDPPTPILTAGVPEYAGMLTLKWDVFTGFQRVNAIKKAQAERAAASAALNVLQLDLAAEVWRSYYTFHTALKKYQFAIALLAASDSAYTSNLRSYTYGLATILDLLAAERDLASARYAVIESKAEVLISAAAVSYAIGAVPAQAAAAP